MPAPVITAISPTPGTLPGAVGGMPSAYAVAAFTPVVVDVTDADGASDLKLLQISALFLDGSAEVVYRGGGLVTGYVTGSQRTSKTNGFRFSLARDGGWPASSQSGAPAVGIAVDVSDGSGNTASATFYYLMPARTTLAAAPPVVADGAIDLLETTLKLVVTQLRA